jgi:hypothetical protein
MGRHPRWALDLCEVDVASAGGVVRAFLNHIAGKMPAPGPMADAIDRMGMPRLRQEILKEA